MEKDRSRPENRKPPLVTEIPLPSQGVTQQVFTESATSSYFLDKTKIMMQKENPHVLNLIVVKSVAVPFEKDMLTWAFRYYEINSRTARQTGKPMVKVGWEVIDSMIDEKWQEKNRRKDDEDKLADFFEEMDQTRLGAEEHQSNKSHELSLFWTVFNDYCSQLDQRYQEDYQPSLIIRNLVHDVGEAMHRQIAVNKFENHFRDLS